MEIKLDPSKLHFKVDFKKLFQNFFDFKIGAVLTEIIDVEDSQEASAFALLFNVAHKTNIQLAKELNQKAIDDCQDLTIHYSNIESELSTF
jgi:hypothetical protein